MRAISLAFWSMLAFSASAKDEGRPRMDDYPADRLNRLAQLETLGFGSQFTGLKSLAWTATNITVAFYGGSDPTYRLIEATAKEWEPAGSQVRLSFRTSDGAFRRWSPADRTPKALIRVRVDEGLKGYWSDLGMLARITPAGEATLNLQGFERKLAAYTGLNGAAAWSKSYERSVVLHEIGHALGFSHEHLHPVCQADLKLRADPGYVRTTSGNQLLPDSQGRSPGVVEMLMHQEGWSESNTLFQVDLTTYLERNKFWAGKDPVNITELQTLSSSEPDRQSIMLYEFPAHVWKSGGSKCLQTDFATALSAKDRAGFLALYPMAVR